MDVPSPSQKEAYFFGVPCVTLTKIACPVFFISIVKRKDLTPNRFDSQPDWMMDLEILVKR